MFPSVNNSGTALVSVLIFGTCVFLTVLRNSAVNCYDYKASLIDEWMRVQHWRNDTDGGNQSTLRKTNTTAALFTTSPTRTGLGLKLGLCGDASE
jgi:hypothetical protein